MQRLPIMPRSGLYGKSKPYSRLNSKKPSLKKFNIPAEEPTLSDLTEPMHTIETSAESLLIDLTLKETPVPDVNTNEKEWIDSLLKHGNFLTLDGPESYS